MKNVLTIIKKEFYRFFKDWRMVITILLPGILIYVLYSLMGAMFENMAAVEEDYVPVAYVVNLPQNALFSSGLSSLLDVRSGDLTEEQVRDKVAEGEADIAVVFPENFDGALAGESAAVPDVHIYYNSSDQYSTAGYALVSAYLDYFNTPAFTVNGDASVVFDLAEDRDTASMLLSMMVPMLMFALLASSCMAVAPESIAGEKERGTMATMLITPVRRVEIVLGKIISLTCFAMLSGISSFLGVILSLPKLMGGVIGAEAAYYYGAGDYFMMLGIILSVVLVIISAFSVLSALAKSVKEAGAMITPCMIIIILLGLASILTSSPSMWLYAVPLLGSGFAVSAVLAFSATPLAVALCVLSNLALTALLVVLLAFMFKSEKIMFKK